jgi:hypothetical protein
VNPAAFAAHQLASFDGGQEKCSPRNVPALRLCETLACTTSMGFRARQFLTTPGSSEETALVVEEFGTTTRTPGIGVLENQRTPVQILIQLPGTLQVIELSQARESTELIHCTAEFNALEKVRQLASSC